MVDNFDQVKTQFQELNDLDRLAFEFGSDKGTQSVNNLSAKFYTKVYYDYFQSIRNCKLSILEIGIYSGSSLKMWNAFFPNADVYGIDINPECKQYEDDRIKIFIGSQNDKIFLNDIVNSIGSEIHIIIDDGSHKVYDHQVSLEILFPHLSQGGLYFIEDMHTAYWNNFGGGYKKRSSTIEFAKKIIDQINKSSIRTNWLSPKPLFIPIFDQVYSIQFFQSLLVIKKKFE